MSNQYQRESSNRRLALLLASPSSGRFCCDQAKRDKTLSFFKDQESNELLASISAQLQVPQAPEQSHSSDQRAENSNKPVVDVHPEVTRSKRSEFKRDISSDQSLFCLSHSNKADET